MDTMRTLNTIGKSVFIKYYFHFKNKSRDYCVTAFTEDFTDKAKLTRTSAAQRIFREGKQLEALQVIVGSAKIDAQTRAQALSILEEESNR